MLNRHHNHNIHPRPQLYDLLRRTVIHLLEVLLLLYPDITLLQLRHLDTPPLPLVVDITLLRPALLPLRTAVQGIQLHHLIQLMPNLPQQIHHIRIHPMPNLTHLMDIHNNQDTIHLRLQHMAHHMVNHLLHLTTPQPLLLHKDTTQFRIRTRTRIRVRVKGDIDPDRSQWLLIQGDHLQVGIDHPLLSTDKDRDSKGIVK